MPKVTFEPTHQTFEGKMGESILDVALRNNVSMQHACGGFSACSTCQVEVISGENSLSPMEKMEKERLEGAFTTTYLSRLSCQAKLLGDVIVKIVNPE